MWLLLQTVFLLLPILYFIFRLYQESVKQNEERKREEAERKRRKMRRILEREEKDYKEREGLKRSQPAEESKSDGTKLTGEQFQIDNTTVSTASSNGTSDLAVNEDTGSNPEEDSCCGQAGQENNDEMVQLINFHKIEEGTEAPREMSTSSETAELFNFQVSVDTEVTGSYDLVADDRFVSGEMVQLTGFKTTRESIVAEQTFASVKTGRLLSIEDPGLFGGGHSLTLRPPEEASFEAEAATLVNLDQLIGSDPVVEPFSLGEKGDRPVELIHFSVSEDSEEAGNSTDTHPETVEGEKEESVSVPVPQLLDDVEVPQEDEEKDYGLDFLFGSEDGSRAESQAPRYTKAASSTDSNPRSSLGRRRRRRLQAAAAKRPKIRIEFV